MNRKKTKFWALLIIMALCLNMMPITALAADATAKYVNVTSWSGTPGESDPTGVELSDTSGEATIGKFVYGADGDTYTLTEDLMLLINNVDVSLGAEGACGDYKISGTGSLNMGNYTIFPGSYTTAFSGDVTDATDVLGFYTSSNMEDAVYSYHYSNSDSIESHTDAYDVTVASGKVLQLYEGLTIKHSLTATDAEIVGSGNFLLTIDVNATVTGLTLYDTNGTDTYTFEATHNSESFEYQNVAEEEDPEDYRWVRQDQGSGPQEPLTAPEVHFVVQNSSLEVGTVKYKIGDEAWKNATLSVGVEDAEHARLEGTIPNSESLAQGSTIYIKIIPAEGYEMDTERGVNVRIGDADSSPIANGVTSIISEDGLLYTLSSLESYEFEFAFQTESSEPEPDPNPQSNPTVSFRVQNTDTAVGTVQYKIGEGAWTPVSLVLEGEVGEQYLAGSITEILAEDSTVYIKATPADGYELDSERRVYISVDGSRSEVTNGVTAIVNADGLSYVLDDSLSYEFEFGFQTAQGGQGQGGEGEGGGTVTPEQVKGAIDGRHWAYAGADSASVKEKFITELWDILSHEYSGFFENIAAVETAITLSDSTSTVGSEFEINASVLCPYYSFTVELGDNDATGKIYLLTNLTDYVVCTNVGTTNTFHIVSGTDCNVIAAYDSLGVFGNGVAMIGSIGSGNNFAAFHVEDRVEIGGSAFRLTVYKPTFTGGQIAVPNNYVAPAWGFAQAKITEFSSTSAAPIEFGVFYGNGSVTLNATSLAGDDITAINEIVTTLPNGVVTIVNNMNGSFTVTFNSNFYDEVPLTVSYTDGSGVAKTGYLTLKRVGIDIQYYQKTGSNTTYSTLHGTEPGLSDQTWGSDNYVVYASYYYPTNSAVVENVDLFAIYTWANGSVTREYLTTAVRTDANGNAVAIDDFVLYKGTQANAPTKIEVTAVKRGTTTTNFAGVTLGSGAGVSWTR